MVSHDRYTSLVVMVQDDSCWSNCASLNPGWAMRYLQVMAYYDQMIVVTDG